jgi:hypothetical protein
MGRWVHLLKFLCFFHCKINFDILIVKFYASFAFMGSQISIKVISLWISVSSLSYKNGTNKFKGSVLYLLLKI